MTSSSPHSYSETMAHDTISRCFRKKTLTHPRFGSLPSSIPLIIPNDCEFDISADDGERLRCMEGVKREGLKVVEEALDLLKAIDKPVGVLSICGPCRSGKSYVLSRILGTGDAFELGHTLDPKTLGIWMGTTILECEEFALLLLDTEGIDATHATARDDASILVMTILLSSYLIYNSLRSPKRNDLQKMSCFLKLSEGIAIRNIIKPLQKSIVTNDEDDDCEDENEDLVLFRQHFPNFLWLLRDVHLVPVDKEGALITPTEYLKTRVLKDSQSFKHKAKKSNEIARAILTYFPTIESILLPPPSTKQEVMQQIAHNETSLSEEFNKGVESLVTYLLSVVKPKRGFVAGRLINGALLAELACVYVKHINDPSAVPTLESTWYSVIQRRCNEVIKTLVFEYIAEMSDKISNVGLPMEEEVLYIEETMEYESTKQRPETLFALHRKISSQKTNALLDQVGLFLSGVTAEDDGLQITKTGILQELSDQLAIVKETEEKYGVKKITKKEVSGGALQHFWLQNIKESKKACKRFFDELYAPIKDRATSNDPNYTFDVFLKELTEMMETYYVQAVGPAKWRVGEDGRDKVESEKSLFKHIHGFQEKTFKDAQEAAKVKAQQEELNAKVLSLQSQRQNDAEQQKQIIERMQEEHRKEMEASHQEAIRRQAEEYQKYLDFIVSGRKQMADLAKQNAAVMKQHYDTMMTCMRLQSDQQMENLAMLTGIIRETNKLPPSIGNIGSTATKLDLLQKGEALNTALQVAINEWKPVREKTIPLLEELADNIEYHYKNTNIGRITGASTAIVGGALVVTGTVASFFTYDLAAPIAAAGTALAVGGGVTAAGSSIADIIVGKTNLGDAQEQIDVDQKSTKKVVEIINIIEKFVDNIPHLSPQAQKKEILEILLNIAPRSIAPAAEGGVRAVIGIGRLGEYAANLGKIAISGGRGAQIGNVGISFGCAIGWMRIGEALPAVGEIAATTTRVGEAAVAGGAVAIRIGEAAVEIGGNAARMGVAAETLATRLSGSVMQVVGAGFEVILLPFNIYEIVTSGMSLAEGSKTKASSSLREKATEYKKQMEDILKVVSGDL